MRQVESLGKRPQGFLGASMGLIRNHRWDATSLSHKPSAYFQLSIASVGLSPLEERSRS